MDDTVVLFLLGGSGFERICLQVGTVNRWLPERCFGFVFFLALIGKLSTNRTVLLQKKNKQTDETQKVLRPHLCLSSRKDWKDQCIYSVCRAHLPPRHASAGNTAHCCCVTAGLLVHDVQFTVTVRGSGTEALCWPEANPQLLSRTPFPHRFYPLRYIAGFRRIKYGFLIRGHFLRS